ncbi:IS200/IS605 family accessory protein TnpB-related protein [Streptomyces sp. NPDC057302]|uniref:IS200/IS605 family accessory protein TnpB-related protein n=1 Tax=Streptomyces sp. NPDC057302 TaxID=3346094 RepID=UPI003644719B
MRLSERDESVLRELGDLLSELAVRDLAERALLGEDQSAADFARRKRELTALTSSRWAGTIVRRTNEQWALARRGQAAHLQQLSAAIASIEGRLAVPVASCDAAGRTRGYPTQQVRAAKQQRLQHLSALAARVAVDLAAGRVHVVRGGKGLLRNRLHLDEAGIDLTRWRQGWRDARTRIEADGESGKTFGNQSIQISPEGTVLIKLPPEQAARHAAYCDRFGRYRLDATCAFAYRDAEWRSHVTAHRSVGYTIRFDADRCFLTAAFVPRRARLPAGTDGEQMMKSALAGGVVGVDHNADHLAAWRLDTHGNPVGRPERVAVDYRGSTQRRDAQIRQACSTLIRHAKGVGATALVVEDLGFDTGRETCGWTGRGGRRFRALVSGMPTAKFAARLVAMAHRAGLAVIVVDPAYSSRWGAQHWRKATGTKTNKTSRHDAAAIVLGRRGQGLGARRRAEKSVLRKQTEAARSGCVGAHSGAGTEDHRPPVSSLQPAPAARSGPESTPRTAYTMRRADGAGQGSSPPKTVRGGPSRGDPSSGISQDLTTRNGWTPPERGAVLRLTLDVCTREGGTPTSP